MVEWQAAPAQFFFFALLIRMSVKRLAVAGKIYSYVTIGGVPIREYARQNARKRYVPHPNARVKASELDSANRDRVREMHASGQSQCEIARALGTTRYRVQRELGVR